MTARTIPELIRSSAELYTTRPAIVDGDEILSYEDLYHNARCAARALIAMGVHTGDRVAVWAPNVWEWVVAALGIQIAGGILVPLNTRFKGAEAMSILNRCQANLLFTVSGFLDINYLNMLIAQDLSEDMRYITLRGNAEGAQGWSDFMALGDSVSDDALDARVATINSETQLDLLFTSGTTGQPKGVNTVHGQNIQVYDMWSNTVGLDMEDKYLIVNPFFHSFGYKAGWLSAIIRGCTIYPLVQFDLERVLECIQVNKISMFPGPPAIYQSILKHPNWREYDISSLRLAVTGAASVPVDLIKRIQSDLGFERVVTAYGLTESCGTVTICRPGDSAERIAHTAGCAMPGVELRCVDTDANDVPVGEPGELLVRGYNVMRGYYKDPEATAQAIDDEGWLRTGDVAVMDAEGYIRITDRIKDIYISGGFNCYPAEIENMLCDMPGVIQVAVIGVPDERMGEVGRAFVVGDGSVLLTEDGVMAWCRENMANYKAPRSVVLVDNLPVNAAGKVLKTELRTHS